MKLFIAVGALAIALVPALAQAGEGNGPDFPGLESPNVGITTSTVPGSTGEVTVTMSNRSDSAYEPASSFAFVVTPQGNVMPRAFAAAADRRQNVAAVPSAHN